MIKKHRLTQNSKKNIIPFQSATTKLKINIKIEKINNKISIKIKEKLILFI